MYGSRMDFAIEIPQVFSQERESLLHLIHFSPVSNINKMRSLLNIWSLLLPAVIALPEPVRGDICGAYGYDTGHKAYYYDSR
jgi:hypothetical protein